MGRTNGYIRDTIIEEVGGAEVVAQAMRVSRAAVYQWHGIVPEKRIEDFCRIFNRHPVEVRTAVRSGKPQEYRLIDAQELEAIEILANLYLRQRREPSVDIDCAATKVKTAEKSLRHQDYKSRKTACGTKG
ncbi:MAG: Cro/CI family transcriptional regulator [Gammaproteobacteria bacterium]|nr:Cro/CI family transcriptional regulator [Gammaproteobacteria bacterium]